MGQKCYQLNLGNFTRKVEQGAIGGVQFLLDYNVERGFRLNNVKQDDRTENGFNLKEKVIQKENEAKIVIETLKPYINQGGGKYVMTAVKDITASKVFLK